MFGIGLGLVRIDETHVGTELFNCQSRKSLSQGICDHQGAALMDDVYDASRDRFVDTRSIRF
jgi:hypothetical protein